MTGVWWFKEENATTTSSIPDIFKRDGTIVSGPISVSRAFISLTYLLQTGTAHSILKILPLLDSMQEDSQRMTFVNS